MDFQLTFVVLLLRSVVDNNAVSDLDFTFRSSFVMTEQKKCIIYRNICLLQPDGCCIVYVLDKYTIFRYLYSSYH